MHHPFPRARPIRLESLQADLAEVLADAGLDPEHAPRLALFIVAAIEGAIALCQAEKSIAPLRGTRDELHLLVDAALAGRD